MSTFFKETVGEGKHQLESVVTITEEGLNIYLGGGEKAHVGAIIISQPRLSLTGDGSISCTTSVINLLNHKDDKIAIPLAEELCKEINQVVVVTAGVHVDNAGVEDIKILLDNSNVMISRLKDRILSSK